MAEAEPVIRAVIPDANVPTSIRSNGVPVIHGAVLDLEAILDTWLAVHKDGIVGVISRNTEICASRADSRVRWLTPELSKGLEFDLVVVIDDLPIDDVPINPAASGAGIERVFDRYVAMTRATQQLVILGG